VDASSLLLELYGRVPPLAGEVVEGLDSEALTRQAGPGANTIGWLVWHLARVEDVHIAEILETGQIWETGDWAERFGVEPDPSNSGYGHSGDEMLTIRPGGPADLLDYLDAVNARTTSFLEGLTAEDLDRVVDERWDPPVTLGVRLVSIADDGLQHVGQAAFLRGLLAL
jgi:uncharacterized damage-inducible protein DinB